MKTAKGKAETIDDYIDTFPKSTQAILRRMRQTIHKAAPEAKETISYRIPTFMLHGFLVHFAAYEKHIGFYPTSSGIEAFKGELSQYKSGRGSVQFPLDQPIPYELVKKITLFRVKEVEKKGRKSRPHGDRA